MARGDGNESAHGVLRDNLAAAEDRRLVSGVRQAVRELVARGVGPDLRGRIGELEARDDRDQARAALEAARQALEVASERRAVAAARLDEVTAQRAWTPRRRGELEVERRGAENTLRFVDGQEARAIQAYAAAEHRLVDAEARGAELDGLRARQARREAYLVEHPGEAAILKGSRPTIGGSGNRSASPATEHGHNGVPDEAATAARAAVNRRGYVEAPEPTPTSPREIRPKLAP